MIKFIPVGNRNEKGKALERVFGAALSKLGYVDLRFNSRGIGEEIDVKGKHRVTLHPIKCQCKAHAVQIPTGPVRTFFGDVSAERGHNPLTVGLFISSSGFSSTALEWYDALNDEDKQFFKLIDEKELFSLLIDAGLVCSEDILQSSVSMKTEIPFKSCSLIMSDRGVFWEVSLEDSNSGVIYYMLLGSDGEIVKKADMDYLLTKEELTSKNYVLLEIKEKILLELLKVDIITLDDLISKLNEPEIEISAAIANLDAELLIENAHGELSLRREIDSLLGLTKYFDDSNNLIPFMMSDYFKNAVESMIIPFIESKFLLKFKDDEAETVRRLIKVSPRALRTSLFGDSKFYKNHAEHLDVLSLGESERKKFEDSVRHGFILKLSRDLMIDNELSNNKDLIVDNKIVLMVTKTEIALSQESDPFLEVIGDKNFTSLFTAGGPVKAGQLIGLTGPGPLFHIASAAMALHEFEKAIETYDSIIKGWPNDTDAATIAIHNKGLIRFNQEKYDEAEKEFIKVKFKKNVRPEVLMNLCRCYYKLNMIKPLQNTLFTLKKNWPDKAEQLKIEWGL